MATEAVTELNVSARSNALFSGENNGLPILQKFQNSIEASNSFA